MADLPIANISRIMKNALPDNAKIAKDAKECVQECVTEFIAFITSEGEHLCPCSVALYSLDSHPSAPLLCLLCTGSVFVVVRGGVVGFEYILTLCSIRKMPPGETKDSQWRRHYIRNDFPRLRKLRRSPQNLSRKVPSGIPSSLPAHFPFL